MLASLKLSMSEIVSFDEARTNVSEWIFARYCCILSRSRRRCNDEELNSKIGRQLLSLHIAATGTGYTIRMREK